MCRDVDDVLVDFAPPVAEGPDFEHVAGGCERNADDYEGEVCQRQVDDEDVRRVAHLFVRYDDDDDKQVSGETEHRDQAEYDGYDDPNDPKKCLVIRGSCSVSRRSGGVFRIEEEGYISAE